MFNYRRPRGTRSLPRAKASVPDQGERDSRGKNESWSQLGISQDVECVNTQCVPCAVTLFVTSDRPTPGRLACNKPNASRLPLYATESSTLLRSAYERQSPACSQVTSGKGYAKQDGAQIKTQLFWRHSVCCLQRMYGRRFLVYTMIS